MERHYFQQTLLTWYHAHKRDLPWRKTTDPYAILVSEMMLQQTQVDRVIPKYQAFLSRFPTMNALANASVGDVLTAWSGLGFNRRALHLHAIAKTISYLPRIPSELQQLKGIGDYTSKAVASFAFNYHAAVVDINVKRVYHRLFLGNVWKDDKETRGKFTVLAQEMLPEESRTWNNAIMDFGALLCTATNPLCGSCPFSSSCKAFTVAKDPAKIVIIAAKPQPSFVGSRRYYRGQLLKLLKEKKSIDITKMTDLWKKKEGWIIPLLATMEKEGLIKVEGKQVIFP